MPPPPLPQAAGAPSPLPAAQGKILSYFLPNLTAKTHFSFLAGDGEARLLCHQSPYLLFLSRTPNCFKNIDNNNDNDTVTSERLDDMQNQCDVIPLQDRFQRPLQYDPHVN